MAPLMRTLGRNGPSIPAIGFGLMSIGGIYGPAPSDEVRSTLLDHAHAIGERFWDTADMYADSEDAVGLWVKQNPDKRKDIFLATKFGIKFNPATYEQSLHSDPEYIKQACERSLKRLNTDYIDLYYCHRVDGKTPIEKTVEAMVELKQQGKIRHIGLSEVSAATLRRAHAVHPIAAVQIEYSPIAIEIEDEEVGLLQTARELGVAIVAYSPMGRGVLSGGYKTVEEIHAKDRFLAALPRFSKENFPKILRMITKFEQVAKNKGCTTGQLAMAWVLSRGEDVLVIPGTRTIKYLEENFATQNIKLTPEEEKALSSIIYATKFQGSRYPEGFPKGYEFGDTPVL
ncbi:aldo-keto reductase (AKR13), putative [Talaromyces stipitatus ATCC 10500]|uniref:Aldo-keto reductase (AKR13), putative n=1 Tax=Talaromyces stipitatus (strain ATCC 10500 / CBS 375.48 / QM 6759 / NRRL 1006) TaxID=441959 RepID=B8LWW7_TALSN|nr:aldo-keto reductase (AKR13), putative [Talaromyces stipitatus ATCC 10500]EED24600.1 aldo-keto reductase (AKR13), putative [Talaromyces stipitatus ATCC 10500]